MLVRYFMTTAVRTLDSTETCADAWHCFQSEGLRRAPVMDGKQVLGIITDRDLIRILPRTIGDFDQPGTTLAYEQPVGECVGANLISVEPNDHLETAARKLLDNKIGALPVIYEGHLKGIITESDLFRVFVQLKHKSRATRLTFHWPANHGESQLPARIALATGVQLHEYFIHPGPAGGEIVALRAMGPNLDEFISRLLKAGFLLIERSDPDEGVPES